MSEGFGVCFRRIEAPAIVGSTLGVLPFWETCGLETSRGFSLLLMCAGACGWLGKGVPCPLYLIRLGLAREDTGRT